MSIPEILHVADTETWQRAVAGEEYTVSGRGMTVADEGFVHCATRAQLAGVLDRHYAGVDRQTLTVLVLDAATISAAGVEVRFENTSGGTEEFPHVYGLLQPSWVRSTEAAPE